jgi:fatty acid synthase subunit alpha
MHPMLLRVNLSVRIFSAKEMAFKEMAFNILGFPHPLLFSISQVEPIWDGLNDLADITTCIRLSLNKRSELRCAIARDN